ncbi:flavin-containing monooxygenase [Catellatospora chokoriensis]|uniref:4-hydroxyacetophenone monooxygenase n=1 Tax=Catellatospora chokoriensis TaxID=310353 RepID=A0A8J3K0S9_9ACTN|nr:NAD(P)/FAD-dependent oxidoreductase [Catellatospora chokoriensis]GIF94596.1 4-hydroxyacetophenone monooxygenase [Catellatospora chokoriensis]
MSSDNADRHTRIAIIGAGFGGIGTAIRLRGAGYRDFLVFDRGDEVGGTWRDNSYPGCACDVPSHLYSFSFIRNPGWSRSFSPQPEIWAYLRRCSDEHGVRPHLRLGHEVYAAAWDADARLWRLDTSHGAYTAQILVAAGGPLTEPSIPELPGLAEFRGEAFHSARWRHDLELAGRRVAVIGTGASAIQFVPQIAPQVAALTLFQRTPAWVLPRRDRRISAVERRLFRAAPFTHRLARAGVYWGREVQATAFLRPALMRLGQGMARRHLRRSVADPVLRERLTPSYTMGCKRVLLSDDFYPALERANVDVVTEPITRVTADGVVTGDGRAHPVDTLVFGTGFHVTDLPMARAIRGADGRTLAEHWAGSMYAYRGTAVTGFPNLFLLLGPNTGLGHNSVVFMIECQLSYLLGALRHLDTTGVAAIEPLPEAQRAYNAALDRAMDGTVWTSGGCRSWYLDPSGRNSTLWPGYTWSYWLRTRRFDAAAYRAVPARTPVAEEHR